MLLKCIISCELNVISSILQTRTLKLRSHTFSKSYIWNLSPCLTLRLNHIRALSAMPSASFLTFSQWPNPRGSLLRIHLHSFTPILTARSSLWFMMTILSIGFPCSLQLLPLLSILHLMALITWLSCSHILRSSPFLSLLKWGHMLQLVSRDLCALIPPGLPPTFSYKTLNETV